MKTSKFRKLAPGEASATDARDDVMVSYADLERHGVPRYSRVHLRRLIARGLFPVPRQVSANRVAWRLSDLAAWKASRPAAPIPRDDQAAA